MRSTSAPLRSAKLKATPVWILLQNGGTKETRPDDEIDLLLLQQRDRYLASVHRTGTDRPVCEKPKTPFPFDECSWEYVDDTSGELLNNTPLEKARAE